MHFLDIMVVPQPNGTIPNTVYRKPIYIDQYLQWDSHHTISAKYSVVNKLIQRTVCSNQQLLQKEQLLQEVLLKFP